MTIATAGLLAACAEPAPRPSPLPWPTAEVPPPPRLSAPAAAAPSASVAAPAASAASAPAAPAPAPSTATSSDLAALENLPEVRACTTQPRPAVMGQGPGHATYAVICANGYGLLVQCRSGACKALNPQPPARP